jgi:ABC-type phosphate/phosphonate transport system ATPase subunit
LFPQHATLTTSASTASKSAVALAQVPQVSLAAAIVDVSSQSDLVNASLEKRRASIGVIFSHFGISELSDLTYLLEQLTSVRRLLKKLQFMFELPSRMRRAIAFDALSEAVQ